MKKNYKNSGYTPKEIKEVQQELLCLSSDEYELLRHRTIKKLQEYLVEKGEAKSLRELKKLPRIKIKGKSSNGKERLIAKDLRALFGNDRVEESEGFNHFMPMVKEGVIFYETENDKRYLYFLIKTETQKSFDLELKEYILKEGHFYLHFMTTCTDVSKKTPFYESYQGKIQDTFRFLRSEENHIETKEVFSSKELFLIGLDCYMEDEELFEERSVITSYAIAAIKSVNFMYELSECHRDHCLGVYNDEKSFENNDYFELINWPDTVSENFIHTNNTTAFREGCHVLNRNTIQKTIMEIVETDKIDGFYIAVGYTGSGGLSLLRGVFDKISANQGECKLIIGSLRNYPEHIHPDSIDKKTAVFLNCLMDEIGLKVLTYDESFYHGKVYCLRGERFHYYIIGSSNLSSNAFNRNFEMDILYVTLPESEMDMELAAWYKKFEQQCRALYQLDEEKFTESDFKNKQKTDINKKKEISLIEAKKMIDQLSDEDTKFRLYSWLKYGPRIISEQDINIPALNGYTMFVYEGNEMAVFESFEPQNRYYVFGMPKGIDDLMMQLQNHSKNEMVNSEYYVERGNHVKNKESVTKKIERLFSGSW